MLNHFEVSHDDSSFLRSSMKVNNENFSSEKNNFRSSEQLWPKISARRITDNISDISEPICDVFLGGTPRRSHSISRPHSITSNEKNYERTVFDYQYPRVSPQHYPPRRRPGCLDPRFKKVTSMKQPAPDSPGNSAELNSPGGEVFRNNWDLIQCKGNPMKLKRIESATQTAPVDLSGLEGCEVDSRDKITMGIQSVERGDSRVIEKSEGTNKVFIPLATMSYEISPQPRGKFDVTPQLSIHYPQCESQGKNSPDHPKVLQKFESGDSEVVDNERMTDDSSSQGNRNDGNKLENLSQPSNSSDERIPVETQDLLMKNYWENYIFSRRNSRGETPRFDNHERMGAPETKRRRSSESLEVRTLEHCTVLSSMINNTREFLGKSDEINVKGSLEIPENCGNNSFPFTPVVEGEELKKCESLRKIPKVRTFVLCGIAIYFLIIIVQAFYENIYYEDNEDVNYVEYCFNYALQSFQEAFRQTFDVMNSLPLQPVKL
ncbi:uncharacterized protein [Fopius arisanus]|uniref:Uncharacterized protein isoform X2 n=1 Tax=Fopius arisanus TaxID=64838 RepID=A0A9R1TL87_9HYME|nr:PREDICTED: uncharacterized protein LOC105271597 isoform X2 [Fopius arisanus]